MFFIEASASAITYCTLALFLGCLMTAGLLLPGGEPSLLGQQLFSFAKTLLPLFIIASIVSLVIQGTKLNSGALPTFEILSRYLSLTQSGKIWTARQIYALLLLGGMFWYGRRRHHLTGIRIFLFLSLPLVASRSLTSHAVAVREHTALAVSPMLCIFYQQRFGREGYRCFFGFFTVARGDSISPRPGLPQPCADFLGSRLWPSLCW